jgi:uncharacterized membrane protein YedE/YeeE
MLDYQVAWYIAGPAIGLLVVAVRALYGARLGVTGGFTNLVTTARRRSVAFDWRGWFVIGVGLGGLAYALTHGGSTFHGYGWMTDSLSGPLLPVALVVSGVLIGYGAKVGGGCTSGNGLSGTSSLSLAAITSTATFFATAIAVTALIEAVR